MRVKRHKIYTMSIRHALKFAQASLPQSSSPQLDAQLLLCRVLAVDKPYLFMYPQQTLSPEQQAQFEALLKRRRQGDPMAYILGTKGFWDLEFKVTPDVLIPRPETEHLIEAALAWGKDRNDIVAADIGTGSGAIAVTIAHHLPQASVHATDISSQALNIAQQNAARNGVQVHLQQGNLAQPLIDAGITVNLLMANLPYIRRDELPSLPVAGYEPHSALDGGADGLTLIRELLQQIPYICRSDALILLEIGAAQGAAAVELAAMLLSPQARSIIKDYAGHDRIVKMML